MSSGSPAREGDPARRRRVLAALAGVCLLLGAARLATPELIRRVAERVATRSFGTPVTVRAAGVSVLEPSLTLRDVTVASPSAGSPRPFASVPWLRVEPRDLPGLLFGGTLRLAGLSLNGLDLASEGGAGGGSTAAMIQDRLREAWRAVEAGDRWVRRVEVDRLHMRDVALTAIASGGSRTRADMSRLTLEALDVEGLAVPLVQGAGPPQARTISWTGASLVADDGAGGEPFLAIGGGRLEVVLSPAGAAGDLAVVVPSLEAQGAVVTVRGDGVRPASSAFLLQIWKAATRGLELPGIASIAVARGAIRDSTYQQTAVSGRRLRVTDVACDATGLEHPQPPAHAATLELRARPFADDSLLELHATGEILAPELRGPVAIALSATDVPLAPFATLHLSSGRVSGRLQGTLSGGVLRGEAVVRIADLEAAPGAPATLRAAYASFEALAGSASPEVVVPIAVRPAEPDAAVLASAVASAVASALARRAGGAAQGALEDAMQGAGDAARSAGEEIRRGIESILP